MSFADGDVPGRPGVAGEAAGEGTGEGTRGRLVRTAAALLEKEGRAAVTLRAVGAGAGVSRSAAYRYFDSKDALLAAVATQALASMTESLAAALARVPMSDPHGQLVEMGRAYLDFAGTNPQQYALIYSREVAEVDWPEMGPAAAAAYGLFVDATARATEAGILPPGDPRPFAAVLLAAAHGAADLTSAGHLQPDKWGIEAGELTRLLLEMVSGASRVSRSGS
ncbi:TetR/AcrR family transcriptional regulator [Parafrankia sp. FMc2]|uniref:TetR/AcrR family transcriptional regulator n=1 Tax=Parafrankia sp. FMc2 TaxID=3233196 RepID=UPI0034D73A28